jgi:hypothetical protein
MIAAMGMNGFFSGFIFMPLIPDIVEFIEEEEKMKNPNFTSNS